MSIGTKNLEANIRGTDSDDLKIIGDQLTVIDALHDVPTADVATNTTVRDVVGNKTDAAVSVVGTTKTIIAYIKSLVQRLDQQRIGVIASDINYENDTFEDVVNITDKGMLKSVLSILNTNSSVIQTGTIQITIDGGSPFGFSYNAQNLNDNGATQKFTGQANMHFDFPFSTSLRIQHKSSISGGVITTTVSYTTD